MSEKIFVRQEPLPVEWEGRRVGLLDALCYVRHQLSLGRGLWFTTGAETVESLFVFINGWAANSQFNARFNEGQDEDWMDFLDWLRDIKHELPEEGWHVKYLRDCQGDHEQAARKFLDFVSEYVVLSRGPPSRGPRTDQDEPT